MVDIGFVAKGVDKVMTVSDDIKTLAKSNADIKVLFQPEGLAPPGESFYVINSWDQLQDMIRWWYLGEGKSDTVDR